MSAYLLRVKAGDEVLAQGTAWLVRPDLAVTAFHVVGKKAARAWLHEIPREGARAVYVLSTGAEDVELDAVACDLRADVALLRCRAPLASPATLLLAAEPVAQGAEYYVNGYPAFHGGAELTISGRVTAVRSDVSASALQVLVNEGSLVSWAGISGSAVRIGDRAAGVVTQITNGAATGWAASFEAVWRLLRTLDDQSLAGAVRELLLKLYEAPEHLADLREELDWPPDTGAGSDRASIAASLADRAALDGADGLLRLLEAVGHDHPANTDVEPLRGRVLAVICRREVPTARTRAQRVREILTALADPSVAGVAVVEPLGFRARALVEEALRQLDRPDEALLPLRFVPERRTASDERLYTTLSRDLRWGAPPSWHGILDARKDESAMDRFEYGVQDLLEGPARESRRQLLFVVEGLERVPADQLEQWGFLVARLSNRGLKLLVWGGQALHELRTQPLAEGMFSAFHVLREIRAGALAADEVKALATARGGTEAQAAVLHRETGGHPALVEELLRDYPEDALSGNPKAIEDRILGGEHVAKLERRVEGDAALRAALRALAAAKGDVLPRGKATRKAETRLSWLGVIKDAGPKSWAWVAPAMRVFAEEW